MRTPAKDCGYHPWPLLLGVLLLGLLLGGCTSGLQQITKPLPAQFERLGAAHGQACGAIIGGPTAYNVIPVMLNSRTERAYQNALASVPGATALTDVTMQEEWYWLVAFSMRCVTIEGEGIR